MLLGGKLENPQWKVLDFSLKFSGGGKGYIGFDKK
jgi:hypothetical protein